MSYSEDIRGLNRLCDKHADAFERSVHGRFPGKVIAAEVDRARLSGLIGRKSQKEIEADCALIDAENAKHPRPKQPRKGVYGLAQKRRNFTDPQRKALLNKVHKEILKGGVSASVACQRHRVSYPTFIDWRKRFGITEPKLPGRMDLKAKRVGVAA